MDSTILSQKKWFFIIILCISSIALIIQTHFLLNCDTSWDLLATKRLLAGGSYTQDFFDLNPPLIFYLLIPLIIITDFLHTPIWLSFYIYTISISFLSLAICQYLVQHIFAKEYGVLANLVVATIAVIFFILPSFDYGEREHFLILLSFPYFLCMSCRLMGKTLPTWLTLVIGIFAGLGFALKPYFLIAPALLELYGVIYTRTWLNWVRVETLIIACFLALYILFTFYYHPDYIATILPLSLRYYHQGFDDTWDIVLFSPCVFYCFFSLIFYLTSDNNTHKIFNTVICVTLSGFLISYFIQGNDWLYRIYPAISFALLLNISLFWAVFQKTPKYKYLVVILGILIFALPLTYMHFLYFQGIEYKKRITLLSNYLQSFISNRSFCLFSTTGYHFFPIFSYHDFNYASRFMHLFWIPAVVKKSPNKWQPVDENRFVQFINEDFLKNKPDYIFVDSLGYKLFLDDHSFDYLNYLKQNTTFKELWKSYVYLESVSLMSFNPHDADAWNLYVIPIKENILAFPKSKYAVILTGSGSIRKAYFTKNNHWIKSRTSQPHIIVRNIKLSEKESHLLEHNKGLVEKNQENKILINTIINKSIHEPFFVYDIYARRDNLNKEKIL